MLEIKMSDLGDLKTILPKWKITDKHWHRLVGRAQARDHARQVRFPVPARAALAAAAAILLFTIALLWFRTRPEPYLTAKSDKVFMLSSMTKCLIYQGTEYRVSADTVKGHTQVLLNHGKAVFAVTPGRHAVSVVLPGGKIRVTGTFFMVKTAGAFDFIVELLKGSLEISVKERRINMEKGRVAVKEGDRLVVKQLPGNRAVQLQKVQYQILKKKSAKQKKIKKSRKRRSAVARRETQVPDARPALLPRPVAPVAPSTYKDITSGAYSKPQDADDREDPPAYDEKPWVYPEGTPWSIKEDIEIWHADIKLPVRWYEELDEMEYKYGRTGRDLEAMAVRRAKRSGADGFIVLEAGRMKKMMTTETEFRRGKAQDLEFHGMDLRDFGVYDSEHYATRKGTTREAFFIRVRFFRYY
jgi:hypothetical protein